MTEHFSTRLSVAGFSFAAAGMLALSGCSEKREQATQPEAKPVAQAAAPAIKQPPSVVAKPEDKPSKVSSLAAYYHFDEADGAAAADSSGGDHAGRLNGGVTAGIEGMVKLAAEFSRSRDGQITVLKPLNFTANTATIVAWVKRHGPQSPNAAVVFCRGGDTVAGLLFGAASELSYAWGSEQTTAEWRSGLAPPDGVWTFVALVVEPAKATMYLGIPGGPLRSCEHVAAHEPVEFSSALTIGRDPILGSGFDGSLDELGIWKNSMSREEIERLFAVGQKLAAAARAGGGAATATVSAENHGASQQPRNSAGWSDPEFNRAVALYNDAQSAYISFLNTRQNPAVLKRIQDNMGVCVDTFERCKKHAPAGLDMQEYIDRCNKLTFQVQGTRQLSP